MNRLEESHVYSISYRNIMDKNGKIKVFTEKDVIEVESEMDFDMEASYKSSINYFIASIVGSIMKSMAENGKKENINITEFESVIKIKLENPLTLLGVKGYTDEPRISTCDIKLYMYADVEDEMLTEFCENNLSKCLIYNTLKDSVKFNIKFIPIM